MQPNGSLTSNPDLAKGLPPVLPPSGKFIAQLFLVPFTIVACLIGFTLLFKWFAGSPLTPEGYLERLDSPNKDVRWRAAETLAQVLLRDDQLASNPRFVLDLADHLHRAWKANQSEEKALAEQLRKQSKMDDEQAQEALRPARNYLLYLSACLGNVMLPIGAPVLSEMALNQEGSDPRSSAQRRRRALWWLANLGENLKRFDRLSPERRQNILSELADAATTLGGERAEWARKYREYLEAQPGSRSLQLLGIDKTLSQCAQDPDPFLREVAAFALNFWEGTAAENTHLEELLLKLAVDDGHGEGTQAQLRDKPESADDEEEITRVPGLKIRYNATIALARRGSDKVRLGVLREMLDLKQQQENFRVRRKNGEVVPDEGTIHLTVATTLQAVAELHRRVPGLDLSELYPVIRELAENSNAALQSEALRTETALGLK